MKNKFLILTFLATTSLATNAWADDVNCYDCMTANNCPANSGCSRRDTYDGPVWFKYSGTELTIYGPSTGDAIETPDATFGGYTISNINFVGQISSIGSGCFSNVKNLTNVTVPNSVTSIGAGAFSDATSLTNVTLGDSVRTIGYQAFLHDSNLTSITLNDSLETIGYYAFGHVGLTNITIPDSVTTISRSAFWGISNLQSLVVGEGVTNIGKNAFAYSSGTLFCPSETLCSGDAISNFNGTVQTYTKHNNGIYEIGGQYYASADEMSQKVTCSGGTCTYQAGCGDSADAQSCLQAVSDYRDTKAASMVGGSLCTTYIECRNLLDMASKDSTYDCGTTGTTSQKNIAVCSQYAKDNEIDLANVSLGGSGNAGGSTTGSGKRIYTVEEARQAVEAAGTDTVNFRIRYK